ARLGRGRSFTSSSLSSMARDRGSRTEDRRPTTDDRPTTGLFGQCRENPLRIDPPDVAGADVGEPDPAEAGADRVAAFAVKLLRDLVGRRIDPRDRVLERRHPDRSFARRDLAAAAGD